jgi:hypothetical protein
MAAGRRTRSPWKSAYCRLSAVTLTSLILFGLFAIRRRLLRLRSLPTAAVGSAAAAAAVVNAAAGAAKVDYVSGTAGRDPGMSRAIRRLQRRTSSAGELRRYEFLSDTAAAGICRRS